MGLCLAMVPPLMWNSSAWTSAGPSMPSAFPYNGSFAGMNLPWHGLPLAWILTFLGPSPDTSPPLV